MNRRLFGVVLALIYGAMFFVLTFARASHDYWPIVREKQMVDGTCMAMRYHNVERCTGLSAPLPRLARAESEPCPADPTTTCLKGPPPGYPPDSDVRFFGYYDTGHRTIVLPIGDDYYFEHEAVHALKWENQADISHGGDEWPCAPAPK